MNVVRREGERVRGRLLLVLGLIFTLALMPEAASAHSVIASSEPSPGQKLGTAPGVVVLEFTEPLNPKLSRATVIDPTGRRFTGGPTGSLEIRVPLSTNATGIYEVEWQSVSTLDGHPWRGSFQFGVGVSPSSGSEGTVVTTPNRSDVLIAVARWVEYLGLILAVGMLLLRRLARGKPELDWVRPRLWIPLAVALAGGVVVVLGEVHAATGSLSFHSLASYLGGGFLGVSRLVRLGLEGLALFAATVGAPSLWIWATGSIGALAATGHGAAIRPTWWGVTAVAVHLLAAGLWAGGILAMATLRPPGGWRSAAGRRLLILFSPPALTAFFVTVVFGAVQAAQELGTVSALFGSSYGRVLVAKILLVGLMLPLSLIAWRLRRPRLRIEGSIAVLVIAAAALLSAFPIPPSRLVEEEAARSAAPATAALPHRTGAGVADLTMGSHAGQVLVGLTVDPGRPGMNSLVLYLLPIEGNAAAAKLRAELTVDGRRFPWPPAATRAGEPRRSFAGTTASR